MKSPTCSAQTLASTLAMTIGLLAPAIAVAQPPAQGPAHSTPNAFSLPVDVITSIVLNKVNGIVNEKNAAFAVDPNYRAFLTVSFQRFSPYMISTTHLDRPNEFAANNSYIFTYTVTGIKAKIAGVWVSYPFSRSIAQSISVQTTCDGWYSGKGKLLHTVIADPSHLEGDHSFVEDAFGALLNNVIPEYVDSQVRSRLASGGITVSTTESACATLGVATKAMGFPYDSIEYDKPAGIPIRGGLIPGITVRVLQVKRLQLHTLTGDVVHKAIEHPALQLWAGYSTIQLQLPAMVEGQVWMPQGPASVETPLPPGSSLLVLIADIVYDGGTSEDSSWITFSKAANYGDGIQTFRVMKTWFDPPLTRGGKPVKRIGAGYEVTVRISSPFTVVSGQF